MRGLLGPSAVVALAITLAGCGDPPGDDPARDGVAPVDTAGVATTGSALDAEQVAWLAQVEADGLDGLELDPGADVDPAASRAMGPAAAKIDESPREIDRTTPDALLGSAIEALAAGDVAALARLSLPRAEQPALDEDDAADAQRRFLAPAVQPYWERVAVAARLGDVSIRTGRAPDEALLEIHVGGAAGAYLIRLRKRGDGWYLAG
jgi:hypothetical protein